MQLLQAVLDTKRGASATADQRAAIEEAMVGLIQLTWNYLYLALFVLKECDSSCTHYMQYSIACDTQFLKSIHELGRLQISQFYDGHWTYTFDN